jgi:ubiquinone/menaquinone biosynthesis C-methylase UbiE
MNRLRKIWDVLGAFFGTVSAVARHGRGAHAGRRAAGGTIIGDAAAYDAHSRFLFGSLFRPIAADIAAVVQDGARVLEVGCGPGHLAVRLARQHGLDVTGVDLDPVMIERARANAGRTNPGSGLLPTFRVGDVASLPFDAGSFDLVVSTLSMHHWADPKAGLAEIGRVLRPDARALIWDFRSRPLVQRANTSDPDASALGPPLRVVSTKPWRWPWRFDLIRRIELVRADDA